MPIRNIPGTQSRYALVAFDSDGRERTDDPDGASGKLSTKLLQEIAANKPSHVFLFSHGWQGDLHGAVDQYDRWIKAMTGRQEDVAGMGAGFSPLWIGLHWPSLPWGESEFGNVDFELNAANEDGEPIESPADLVERYAERLDLKSNAEAKTLIETIVQANQDDAAADTMPPEVEDAYRRLAELAEYKAGGPDAPPDSDGTAFDPVERFEAGNAAAAGVDFGGGGIFGGLLGPLRQLSFWRMKKRARTVGESGMHDFTAQLMNTVPQARFHLMGHSFGCIVMSSIVSGKDGKKPLPRAVESLVLVQGAMSLWAYSNSVPGSSKPGYFRDMARRGAVRGPIVTTQSVHDRAVGTFYPLAVAAVLSEADFGPNRDLPKYGAIGTFGICGADVTSNSMLQSHESYSFEPGKMYNIEGSQFIRKGGGASGAHSDIDGPEVAHLLWQAALV